MLNEYMWNEILVRQRAVKMWRLRVCLVSLFWTMAHVYCIHLWISNRRLIVPTVHFHFPFFHLPFRCVAGCCCCFRRHRHHQHHEKPSAVSHENSKNTLYAANTCVWECLCWALRHYRNNTIFPASDQNPNEWMNRAPHSMSTASTLLSP